MNQPRKVFGCLVWDDAKGSGDDVQEEDILHAPIRYHTYGWVVRSDEVGVTIASEWRPNDGGWRDRTFVPRPMIVEEVVLVLSKKAKKRDRTTVNPPRDLRSASDAHQPPSDRQPPL